MTVSRSVSSTTACSDIRLLQVSGVALGVKRICVVAASVGVVLMSGCSSSPKQDADAKPLSSKVEPLGEFLSRAQVAEAAEGGRERARLIYREAAKAYPTDKRPWARLSQSYFDAGDYGNAVLAAQEVVLRDANDSAAQGLLAVSGLRVSTAALSALRSQNGLSTSARSEAEDMARNLRSILGEPVLVPKPAETPSAANQSTAHQQPRPRKVVRGTGAPASAKAPAKTPVPTQAPSSNPFGALK